MRSIVLIAALCAGVTCTTSQGRADAGAPPNPIGAWQRADGTARVHIAPCGTELCATNTWIKDTSDGEDVGDRLIMNVSPKSNNELAGTAYDTKRNRTYSITLDVSQTALTTRGCVLFGLLCRSANWSRLPSDTRQSN